MDNEQSINVQNIQNMVQKGEYTSAKRDIIHVLRAQPDLVPAWLLLADLVETTDDKAKCYQMVLQINPDNHIAVNSLRYLQNSEPVLNMVQRDIPNLFDDEIVLTESGVPTHFSDALIDNDLEDDEKGEESPPINDPLDIYIIQELGNHVDEDDIIRETSLRGEIDWYEAEKYVHNIQREYALTIAKRQSPLRLIIAIPTLITGVIWFIVTIIIIFINGDISIDFVAVLLQSTRHLIGSLAMILGGAVGVFRVLKSLGKIA